MEEADEPLMVRVGHGDHEACRTLVERHLGRVVAFAARTLGSRSDGEDVAQEVFLRLWTSARRWRTGEGRVTTWLHRVAMNLCLDRLARRREASLDAAPEPIDPHPGAPLLLERQAIGHRIADELAALAPQQRLAI